MLHRLTTGRVCTIGRHSEFRVCDEVVDVVQHAGQRALGEAKLFEEAGQFLDDIGSVVVVLIARRAVHQRAQGGLVSPLERLTRGIVYPLLGIGTPH